MATDLASTPNVGITTQLCGDAHLSNFGMFGTPERQLIFDIDDFDETLPGPWEWDLKRLGASLEIVGRERAFSVIDRRSIVMSGVREYRSVMREAAVMPTLAAWYAHMKADDALAWVDSERQAERVDERAVRAAEKDVAKARTRDSMRVFARRAGGVDGSLRILADPPLIVPIDELAPPGAEREHIHSFMEGFVTSYRRSLADYHHPIEAYRYVDSARRVVGVGSVGTSAWIHLFVGRDDRDPLFLQSKEAQPSVLERFAGRSAHANQGKRVVVGQRLMQAASDIFLGWLRLRGLDGKTRDYYVRQLHDWKGRTGHMDVMRVPDLTLYARLCGATLARAHARWGDRIAIASYLGKGESFDRAIADFASAYADQTEGDYEIFASAVETGRLTAQTGL
jgi:uncharacterized protein (DUF2252 family)